MRIKGSRHRGCGRGLIAYAVNYPDLYYRFASSADKIFKGANPGDLPVEQPTKFELILNANAAKTLDLEIRRHCCRALTR